MSPLGLQIGPKYNPTNRKEVARRGGAAVLAQVGNTFAYSFADAASNDYQSVATLPPDAKAGTTIKFRLLWAANAVTGAVRWQVTARAGITPAVDTIDPAGATTAVTANQPGTAYQLVETYIDPSLTGDPGDAVQVFLARLGNDAADTLIVAALLLAIEVEYQTR